MGEPCDVTGGLEPAEYLVLGLGDFFPIYRDRGT